LRVQKRVWEEGGDGGGEEGWHAGAALSYWGFEKLTNSGELRFLKCQKKKKRRRRRRRRREDSRRRHWHTSRLCCRKFDYFF
jgi:hypothetical protein